MAQFAIEEVPDNVHPLPSHPPGPAPKAGNAAAAGILIALKMVSQAAIVGLASIASHLFSLVTVSMVFWVWTTVPDPNQYQIASLTLFGLFILAVNVIVRRK